MIAESSSLGALRYTAKRVKPSGSGSLVLQAYDVSGGPGTQFVQAQDVADDQVEREEVVIVVREPLGPRGGQNSASVDTQLLDEAVADPLVPATSA